MALSGHTRIVGIIGWPVAHSLSPAMHNAAFAAMGLDWAYVAFPVEPDRVPEAIRGLAAAGVAGLNVTIPHKAAALAASSAASPAAAAIGAANTLIPDGAGGFRCDNTDAEGFLRALDEQAPMDLQGVRVLVLGAGGAARAVTWALRGRGARITVANRTPEKAAELGAVVPFTAEAVDAALAETDLLVNTTSLGLHGDDPPPGLPLAAIPAGCVVADIVYRRGGTPWLGAVAARGHRTVDGLGMLLHQGAAALAQWTGQEPPVDAMREALAGS